MLFCILHNCWDVHLTRILSHLSSLAIVIGDRTSIMSSETALISLDTMPSDKFVCSIFYANFAEASACVACKPAAEGNTCVHGRST
jgi:hypothetical protein